MEDFRKEGIKDYEKEIPYSWAKNILLDL
jgi:hypothetical protein